VKVQASQGAAQVPGTHCAQQRYCTYPYQGGAGGQVPSPKEPEGTLAVPGPGKLLLLFHQGLLSGSQAQCRIGLWSDEQQQVFDK